YLEDEAVWPVFHRQLVLCLHQILVAGLVDRYQARVGQRHYTTEQVPPAKHREDYIEVRQRTDGRLVTLVDAVSPANKTSAAGRAASLHNRCAGPTPNASHV